MILDQRLGNDHEHGRRNALAGNIGDHHGQMVLVDHEEIIEVTADFLGRGHRGIDIEIIPIRKGREDVWQHVGLDRRCQVELG